MNIYYIELTKSQRKILKYIYKNGGLSKESLKLKLKLDNFDFDYSILNNNLFIKTPHNKHDSKGQPIPENKVFISSTGKSWLVFYREKNLKFWIPYSITTALATAAIIKSFFF